MRFIALLALLLVTACAGVPPRNLDVAPGGEQSIILWHKASGERIEVVYRINGHYQADAFSQIDHIFRDRHTDEEYPIDPALIDVITDLRDKMMLGPESPIELTSGYRSPESNAILRTTNKNAAKNSYHMKGNAADIRMRDMNARVMELVAKTMQRGGVALYPDSGHVHVDVGPVRGWEVKRGREDGSDKSGALPVPQAKPIYVKSSAAPRIAVESQTLPEVKPVKGGAREIHPPVPLPPRPVLRAVTSKNAKPVTSKGEAPPAPARLPAKTPAKPAAKAPAKAAPAPAAKAPAPGGFKKLTRPQTPTKGSKAAKKPTKAAQ